MKEHTLYALQSDKSLDTSSAKYDAKHEFSYLDFRCYFEANGQNHLKITSIFGSYRFLRIAQHDIFSLSDLFQKAGICISPVILRSRKANAHLLVNPILKLTIVLIWKTPSACLKFGKTSKRAVENFPQRKLWVWAALIRIWSYRTSASALSFGNGRSSHSRIRTSLDPKSVYYEWASD